MSMLYLLLWLWVIIALMSTISIILSYRTLGPVKLPGELPRVVVIAPVRGAGPMLPEFFRRLRSQSYPTARIIIAMESTSDPAYEVARFSEQAPGLPMTTITVGNSRNVGQKVANLLGALPALIASDEVVVFVDADTLPHEEWLLRLILPIAEHRAEAVTGYRWLLVKGENWGGYWVAATNNAIASMARSRFWNVAWGGSFAIKRELLERIEIASWWKSALSDDLQLTRALWSHGVRIVYARGGLVASTVDSPWPEAIEFGRRQFLILRTHLLVFWMIDAILVATPLAAGLFALTLALEGDRFGIALIVVIFAISQVRCFFRWRIAAWVMRDKTLPLISYSSPKLWIASMTHPLFHAVCLLMSLSSRRLTWAGIDYEIKAPQRIRRF